MRASASSVDLIEVQSYDVEMTVHKSRKVEVKERIRVQFLYSGLTMFYRSLPTDGAIYSDIQATCTGNANFYYEVADNPDLSGFIDVNCIGGVQKNAVWTYEISYFMQQGVNSKNGMNIDIVGYGWSVPLHNVTATLHLPSPVQTYKTYLGEYGTSQEYPTTLSEDKKTLTVQKEVLEVVYNDKYNEWMAEGVSMDFVLEKGVLDGYAETRIFTEHIWKLLLVGMLGTAAAVLLWVFKKRREILPIVHIKPPENMTPMQMGKIIDGGVNNEDITSMIYYFADKGYLKINFENEDDPELIRLVQTLPEGASPHEKTLFRGLFKHENAGRVTVSKLARDFYTSATTAKAQVLSPKPMYDKLSWLAFLSGGIFGVLFALFGGVYMGKQLGGGYFYVWGIFLLLPIALGMTLAAVQENYRYKWKVGKRWLFLGIGYLLAAVCSIVFVFCFAEHVMTEWEKAVLCVGCFLPVFLTQGCLTRTEKYVQTLGDILGFKDFIVATEEDKIKFMLEEEPELYYKVLPYAQVLGVTDEWEEKFAKITLEPPTWYVGSRMTVFDYMIINRCMTRTMVQALASAAMQSVGGGHIGKSGGGGGFGGFGGGGFGGGGGGAR